MLLIVFTGKPWQSLIGLEEIILTTFAANGYVFPRGFFNSGNGESWEPLLAHMTANMADYGFYHRIVIPETGIPPSRLLSILFIMKTRNVEISSI